MTEKSVGRRPWGVWRVLCKGPGYKVKKIQVNPGCRLSLQKHHHRNEHWVVVSGTARVTRGRNVKILKTNQSLYVPQNTVHRIANFGSEPLLIVEVQTGAHLREDDIVRLADDYSRK